MRTDYKVIFTGPVGAGKTTAVNTISSIPTIKTEAAATDATKNIKETTTVALDYGVIILENNTRVHLYGTPGQKRFDFMWDILTTGGVGLLLLIDGSDESALEHLQFFLKNFETFITKTSVVVGVTKQDVHAQFQLDDYREVLKNYQPAIPVLEIDVRNRKDISLLLETLLHTLDPDLSIAV